MQTQQHEEQTTNPTPLVLDTAPDVKLDLPSTTDTTTQEQAEQKKKPTTWRRFYKRVHAGLDKVEYSFFSQVLGTQEFNQRYASAIQTNQEEYVKKFQNISSTEEDKACMLSHILRHSLDLAQAESWWEIIVATKFSLVFIILLVATTTKYSMQFSHIYSYPKGNMPVWVSVYILLSYLVILSASSVITFRMAKRTYRAQYLQIALGMETTMLVVSGGTLYYLTHVISLIHASFFQVALIQNMVTLIQLSFTSIICNTFFLSLAFLFLHWRKFKYPDAVAVINLAQALQSLDTQPKNWTHLRFKRNLIANIEEAAMCVQNHLPRHLASRNLETLTWQKQTFGEIAATIRATTQWVSTPKPDTRERLIERLRLFLECAVSGEWDTLTGEQWKAERAQAEALIRPVTLSERLVATCRVLLMTVLPPLGVYIFHILRPKIELSPLLIGAAIGWPILNLLAAVEPDLKSKIATFKDAASLFPPSGKDKR